MGKGQVAKKVAKAAPAFIEKPIGGDKNGGKRMVRVKKLPAYYAPEQKGKKSSSKNFFSKQLASGLCLVTGPYKINSCPMRRINQNFLIATATKLDISSVELPENINDAYFRRVKTKR